MIDVFISHPTPFNQDQEKFLELLKLELAKHGLNGVNLGTNNWSVFKPLKPIKELIAKCKGALIVGLERSHSYIGYDKEDSAHKKEFIHRRTTSAWIHIEGGMAYQAGLPMLILRENNVEQDGMLDPNNSESYIYAFALEQNIDSLSYEICQMISSWVSNLLG